MPLVAVTPDLLRSDITFSSKAGAYDETSYKGTVVATNLSYHLAMAYNKDLVSYNSAVRQADPTVDIDIKNHTFFVVLLATDTTSDKVYIAFSNDWILPGSLDTLIGSEEKTLKVYYHPGSITVSQIKDHLRDIGVYVVEVVG